MTTKAEFVIQRKSAAVHSIHNSRCTNPDLTKIDEDLLDLRNLQEQVKKAFCYQKLFRPFTVRINCSRVKQFANSWPLASNFQAISPTLKIFCSLSRSEQFW